jgi:hypothetical protein
VPDTPDPLDEDTSPELRDAVIALLPYHGSRVEEAATWAELPPDAPPMPKEPPAVPGITTLVKTLPISEPDESTAPTRRAQHA